MIDRSARRLALTAATVIVAAGMLSACAPAHSSASPKHHSGGNGPGVVTTVPATVAPGATPVPTPSASGLGPLPANALFRITAVATQTGGAKADLVETVFAPIAPDAADTALLNKNCNFSGNPSWSAQYAGGTSYITTTITATQRAGTPTFKNHDLDVLAQFNSGPSAYSGDWAGFEAACSPGVIRIPGTVHGVTPALTSNPVTGRDGWAAPRSANYGFYGTANNPNDPDFGGGDTTVDSCKIEISPAALAKAPAISAWLTTPFVKLNGCAYVL